jgi:hypothetical protein
MIIDHHSPSSLNMFAASPAMYVLERLLKKPQVVGVPAHRGVAVEAGIAHGLLHPATTPDACYEIAMAKYNELAALSTDERKDKVGATIPEMVQRGLLELLPYGTPSKLQGRVEWRPDGLRLPIIGFYDFYWEHDIVVDLKTTERMPSEVKVPHARQVALYAKCLGNGSPANARIAYVTPKKSVVYEVDQIEGHLDCLRQIALRVEAFLSLSDDPEFFTTVTAPDLESFYWASPEARALAYEHWRI